MNVSEGDLGHIGPGILEFDETTSDIEKNGCDNASIQKKTHEQNGTVGFVMPKKNGHFPATNDTNTPDSDKEMLSKQVCTFWLIVGANCENILNVVLKAWVLVR